MAQGPRRKSLLIGINYTGSQHQLRGCQQDVNNMAHFLSFRGYGNNPRDQVILRDDREGPYFPTGHNILAAMDWLVSEPGTCNFLHYSGHGGQVPDPDGDRESGFDDTIVPVDFERNGQISSDILHRHLVSALAPRSTLFVIMDCCHSGSVLELPLAYRSDEDGNINVMQGVQLLGSGLHLIQGGFNFQKIGEAEQLYQGARSFFTSLKHAHEYSGQAPGLHSADDFGEDWSREMKCGCRDDQTSADANIAGANVGAMSWAFLEVMKHVQYPTYQHTLQMTRQTLDQSNYQQIPQLSVGREMDLNTPLII